MKLLKIDNYQGYFLSIKGDYLPVQEITKDELLHLAGISLESEVEIDEYSVDELKNPAQQIIYESIYKKLQDLCSKRKSFKDDSETLFYQEYEKYKPSDTSAAAETGTLNSSEQ
ncbi:MAG: hypothetical protein RKH07_14430 [Gammaproteobacteria bacterium]